MLLADQRAVLTFVGGWGDALQLLGGDAGFAGGATAERVGALTGAAETVDGVVGIGGDAVVDAGGLVGAGGDGFDGAAIACADGAVGTAMTARVGCERDPVLVNPCGS